MLPKDILTEELNITVTVRQLTGSDVYQGKAGSTYEFLALATDNAGNREELPLGLNAPDDGSQVNLGELASLQTTVDDTIPPDPIPTPSTNLLFTEAQLKKWGQIPVFANIPSQK